jgi:L-threonylcarbamoyladenylate synthase
METILLSAADPSAIDRVASLLAEGLPVALPTETVYGLAADALRAQAAAAIFQAKERPFFDPLIVHLPARDWLDQLAAPPLAQRKLLDRLLDRFWPGPLTLLLPRRPDAVPDLVTAGSPLVAVRMSAHPVFQAVAARFGRPLAAPSANRFGRISPTSGPDVLAELGGRIPLILDAGPTEHGLESTIVALREDGGLDVLRCGPVTMEMLEEFAPARRRASTGVAAGSAVVPGQLPSHYAPRTPLRLLPESSVRDGLRREMRVPSAEAVGLLGFRRDFPVMGGPWAQAEYLSQAGDLREAAVNLFASMRRLDAAGLNLILAEPVPEIGLGEAIMERLRRAAAGSV